MEVIIKEKVLQAPEINELNKIFSDYKYYDSLLGRLSTFIREKRGSIVGIDVGSNIGDSIAHFELRENDTYLAIEPDSLFLPYLKSNWPTCQVVKLERYCSDHNCVEGVSTIDAIIAEHSWFYSNLLKIDTDGHDLKAILGASEYIKREVPYLLFEYDLTMKPANLEDTDKVLDLLSSAGYGKILFIPT